MSLYGLETIGFLTLSFADHVTDAREAGRRFNSLLTNVIRPRYKDYVAVMERMKNKRIHFHLLVPVGADIRSGFDFAAVKEKDYRSASVHIRGEWAFWRNTAPKYRFGRTELMPIKSNKEAVSFYVGKYIRKHIEHRTEEDKGVRLVRTSFRAKAGTTRFAWNTIAARLWREKIALLAGEAHMADTSAFGNVFGRHWMYKYQDIIQSVTLPKYWSHLAAELDCIPPGMRLAVDAMRFHKQHGTLRMTAREALLAIGEREHTKASSRDKVPHCTTE